nr:hypothetical protein [Mycoplasmopsis bovis]
MGLKKLWDLLNEFGSLEAIYENIGKISGKTKEYFRKRLWISSTFAKN